MSRINISPKSVIYVLLGLVLLWVIYNVGGEVGEPFTTNASGNNQLISTKQPYADLDLRVANSAIYQGSPIKKLKDLGVDHQVNRMIISFAVPADSLTEYGLMTTPQTPTPAAGYPVIILLHGYIQPSVYSTKNAYLSEMEFYSQHGFVVIKPDLRGQGLSIHAGKPEGAYYSMAYNTDVMSLIASVKRTPGLNPSNMSLWGHSMGAYLALRAAVLSPDIKNVILLSAPAGYVQDMYMSFTPRSDFANPVAFSIRKKVLAQHGTPLNNPNYWDYTSPINFLANTRATIQIYVGAKDTVVPPKFSADLNQALDQLQAPHYYYVYPNGKHGLLAERSQIYERSLQILQVNNK